MDESGEKNFAWDLDAASHEQMIFLGERAQSTVDHAPPESIWANRIRLDDIITKFADAHIERRQTREENQEMGARYNRALEFLDIGLSEPIPSFQMTRSGVERKEEDRLKVDALKQHLIPLLEPAYKHMVAHALPEEFQDFLMSIEQMVGYAIDPKAPPAEKKAHSSYSFDPTPKLPEGWMTASVIKFTI